MKVLFMLIFASVEDMALNTRLFFTAGIRAVQRTILLLHGNR